MVKCDNSVFINEFNTIKIMTSIEFMRTLQRMILLAHHAQPVPANSSLLTQHRIRRGGPARAARRPRSAGLPDLQPRHRPRHRRGLGPRRARRRRRPAVASSRCRTACTSIQAINARRQGRAARASPAYVALRAPSTGPPGLRTSSSSTSRPQGAHPPLPPVATKSSSRPADAQATTVIDQLLGHHRRPSRRSSTRSCPGHRHPPRQLYGSRSTTAKSSGTSTAFYVFPVYIAQSRADRRFAEISAHDRTLDPRQPARTSKERPRLPQVGNLSATLRYSASGCVLQ